jgi:hypothetical protein
MTVIQSRHLTTLSVNDCYCCNGGGKALKLQSVMDCNHHISYDDRSDKMANSFSVGQRKFKWMKKLFFHKLDLPVANLISSLHTVTVISVTAACSLSLSHHIFSQWCEFQVSSLLI